MTRFEYELREWLKCNGFDCDFCFDEDFAYNYDQDILHVGINDPGAGIYFEQFLYEYGLEYMNIYTPVLALLHELGHASTIHNFDEDQLNDFSILKYFINSDMSDYEANFAYWSVTDEFVANMWEIDFINEHINAVNSLCEIYYNHWNDFVEEYCIA